MMEAARLQDEITQLRADIYRLNRSRPATADVIMEWLDGDADDLQRQLDRKIARLESLNAKHARSNDSRRPEIRK